MYQGHRWFVMLQGIKDCSADKPFRTLLRNGLDADGGGLREPDLPYAHFLPEKSYDFHRFGHAVYTVSDPRALLLKEKARLLSKEKGREDEMALYEAIERIGPEIFYEFKGSKDKLISPNVDFYSGFVYDCLKIPKELYTPLFAI